MIAVGMWRLCKLGYKRTIALTEPGTTEELPVVQLFANTLPIIQTTAVKGSQNHVTRFKACFRTRDKKEKKKKMRNKSNTL